MDKRELENIIVDQREELDAKRHLKLIHRDAEDLIDFQSPLAQVVIGVRRSGKSTLCYKALMANKIKFAYFNLDDERLIDLKSRDLNDLLEVLYKVYGDFDCLFIDEIQNIPEWYLFVNRLLRRGMHVLITGSNAKLLSGELATHLTGRHHTITLYPFSFKEYCRFKELDIDSVSTKATAALRAAFDEYMMQGGFPELLSVRDKRGYIINLVDSIIKRDIFLRFKIKHRATFEKLSQNLLNESPCVISYKNLKESFAIGSVHTVKNYVRFLTQAYLLIGLHRFSFKSRQRLTSDKVYPIDVSLMNNREDAFNGKNLGLRLEAIVYLDLLRRYKPMGYDIYFFNDRSFECDFLVCNGNTVKEAIQVAYDISNEKTFKREVNGLIEIAKKTKTQNLVLLTDHDSRDIEVKGHRISIRPVYEYFLH